MNREVLSQIIEKLNGLDWFFISGFAIEVYTNGKRKAKDIDIAVHKKDISTFANLLGCKVIHRKFKKQDYIIDDYGFETTFNGQSIEVASGYPKIRMLNNTFEKVFDKRVKRKYLGIDVYLAPIEDLIIHKVVMHRPKDIEDLKLLVNHKIDNTFLKELIKDWKTDVDVLRILRELNYKV